MNNRKILSVFAVVMLLTMATFAQASTTLMQIGRSPFHQPPLTTVDSFITMVQDKEADVKKGFAIAGNSELFAPFIAQIATTQIDTVDFQKGSHFEWMMFKKKGKGTVRVAKDVTWAAEKPFPGFKFDVDHKGNRYTFAVPFGCGNIALMGMRFIPVAPVAVVAAPVTAPAAPVNQSPQCGMTVSSVQAFCGEIVTVDASGSSDPDGSIEKMTIAFVDGQGNVVSEQVVDGGALVGQIAVPCGANTLKVTVTDSAGESVTSDQCTAEVTGTSRTRFLFDVGYYHQVDPANYLFGRVGLEYKFNERFGVLGMIGAAPRVEGEDGKSAFLIDLIGEYTFGSRYFIDLGLGGWLTSGDDDLETENSQLDLIAAFGARVYGEPDEFNASLFVEARSGVDEMSDFGDYGRLGFGVRFRF